MLDTSILTLEKELIISDALDFQLLEEGRL